ncbi:MAG: hypothetical protein ACP5HJ_04085, partial [Candidatus Micrarchaeia archaeon]
VAEYTGEKPEEEAKEILKKSVEEMFVSRFPSSYTIKKTEIYTRSFIPKKKYGAAIVAIVFLSYRYPLLSNQKNL